MDYDEASGCVRVTTGRPYREGQELQLADERPNGELLLATGTVPDSNMSDYLDFPAELLESDKYFIMKMQVQFTPSVYVSLCTTVLMGFVFLTVPYFSSYGPYLGRVYKSLGK